jgi:hypothetical protein
MTGAAIGVSNEYFSSLGYGNWYGVIFTRDFPDIVYLFLRDFSFRFIAPEEAEGGGIKTKSIQIVPLHSIPRLVPTIF